MAPAPVDDLGTVGLREILDADSRPTFVLDLDPDDDNPHSLTTIRPVFCNAALRVHERLLDTVAGSEPRDAGADDAHEPTYDDFRRWSTSVTAHDDSRDIFPLSFLYRNLLWTGSTVRQRWRIISGNHAWRDTPPLRDLSSGAPLEGAVRPAMVERSGRTREPAAAASKTQAHPAEGSAGTTSATLVSSQPPQPPKSAFLLHLSGGSSESTGASVQKSSSSLTLSLPEKAVADWTVAEPKGLLSPHLKYARTVNWATTSLGPMENWSPEFRQTANLCMNNPHPAALFWGSDLTMLYNEAYAAEVAGNKHPSLMGTGFSGPFAELWDYAGPIFAECARTGLSVRKENDYLPIDRHGLLEETFYSWTFTPLYGGTNRILGFYNAPFETTRLVVNQRRMETINKLGGHTAHAKTIKQFWSFVLDGLQDNHFDIPFALLYSVGESEEADHSSQSSGSTISLKSCHLEGSIAVPEGHLAAQPELDLKRSREGFVPSFREAMRTREPTLLHTRDGTLPMALLEGIHWRGFGDPCQKAIIFPVRPTNGDTVLAFLVLGINPRRPYDDDYKAFTSMLNRQLATSLASVILFEDEVRRSRNAAEAAALEKEQLTQQLNLQASRLRRMTELSPLGMFLISPAGVLREANDRFFEMTGHNRDSQYEMSWMDFIMESSTQTMKEGWHRLVNEHLRWTGELQLKKRGSQNPVNPEGESVEYWVLFIAHTEFASDGSLRSIMGSITDISQLKWAQGLKERQLLEAEETRRQQNEFIDITSHEMRNPLSAILQCADDILATLGECNTTGSLPSQDILDACVDAATTITLCVQHQKAIVDDILTISKLDSSLLLITPVPAQPEDIMRRAVKMFDPELQAKDIDITIRLNPSYRELDVGWVILDPSRVLQILINLMTNAIKFTAPAKTRNITVAVSASTEPPAPPESQTIHGFQYIPSKTSAINVMHGEEYGPGEIVYIGFEVHDSGCGLTLEEKQILFQRFKQASPRTHAQYGGSGLGLFISKRLAELHGGQIGVASEAGRGSLFGFFVQGRMSNRLNQNKSQNVEITMPEPDDLAPPRHGPAAQRQNTTSAGMVKPQAINTHSNIDPREIHVLVVEDNQINQQVLVRQLKKVGCTVHVANDGIEALAVLEQTRFRKRGGHELSVILMDLEMPNMDGLTCVRAIRRMESEGRLTKHVPVIAVTANVRNEQVETARSSGMDDVVSKPFRIPELLSKIEALLGWS